MSTLLKKNRPLVNCYLSLPVGLEFSTPIPIILPYSPQRLIPEAEVILCRPGKAPHLTSLKTQDPPVLYDELPDSIFHWLESLHACTGLRIWIRNYYEQQGSLSIRLFAVYVFQRVEL